MTRRNIVLFRSLPLLWSLMGAKVSRLLKSRFCLFKRSSFARCMRTEHRCRVLESPLMSRFCTVPEKSISHSVRKTLKSESRHHYFAVYSDPVRKVFAYPLQPFRSSSCFPHATNKAQPQYRKSSCSFICLSSIRVMQYLGVHKVGLFVAPLCEHLNALVCDHHGLLKLG